MRYFWTSWKNVTPIEKRYINSLKKAIAWIQNQPFSKDVVSAYVKGSFVYREINKSSDIDFVVIMKNQESLNLIREIRNKIKEQLKPVEVLPIALEELKTNKYFKEPIPGTKGKPDFFTLLISNNRLVYGSPLKTSGWAVRTPEKIFENLKYLILNVQIQRYEKGELSFSQFLKQVMHLIWWQEKIKGKNFPSSWKAIQKACPNNKLLQTTVKLRLRPTKNKSVQSKYIQQVKDYLSKI